MRTSVRRGLWCIAVGLAVSVLTAALLSYGRSAQVPPSLFDSREGAWLDREIQPPIAVSRDGARFGMTWTRSPAFDQVQIRRPSAKEWKEWANAFFPESAEIGKRVQEDLAKRQQYNYRSSNLDWHDRGVPLRDLPPAWAGFPPTSGEIVTVYTAAYGWPIRILRVRGGILADPEDTSAMTGQISDGLGRFANPFVAEPAWGVAWTPIWWGLAASTLVVAGPLWVVWTGSAWAVRLQRRSRGRCGSCGYPAGIADVCSECGAKATRPSKA
jgi:hypothetical protein